MKHGYVEVYMGDGKGKTTASLGLSLRAVGQGLNVWFVQFLKGRDTGELKAIQAFGDQFQVFRLGAIQGFFPELSKQEQKDLQQKVAQEWKELLSQIQKSSCDILVLDEVLGALESGILFQEELIHFLDHRPDHLEVVLTGRNLPEAVAEKADLITEMKCIRHYYDFGVKARKGIEY